MAYKITLSNTAGVLDVRVVDDEDEIRAAVLDIAAGCPMYPGDKIEVFEIEAKPVS